MDHAFYESYRREFPVTKHCIYLDHAGVAPVSLRVKQAIESFLSESVEGGAFHYPKWAPQIVDVRRACAGLIGSGPDEIAFVKSTSHGLSIVAQGLDWKPGDNVLFPEMEFPSNIYPWLNLASKGVEARVIPSRDNRVQIEDIERFIDSRTRLLTISSVQFAGGFRIDLQRVGELCRRKGVLLCVDAIQSLGVLPMDVNKCNIDFLAADAHKWLLGPEGIGIFYCRRELAEKLSPPLVGWKSVQNEFAFDEPVFKLKKDALKFEEGSLNVMGIIGLGAAVELLLEIGIENIQERVLGLGDLIINEAEAKGFTVLTPKQKQARGGIVTFRCGDAVRATARLRERGIMANVRGGALRFSPHFYNTADEVTAVFAETGDLD